MKKSYYLIMIVLCSGYLLNSYAQQSAQQAGKEEIVLTTYYPVPYGDYQQMRVQQMVVGKKWFSAKDACWESGKCAELIDENAALVVDGNVGIGTITPQAKLEVNNSMRLTPREGNPSSWAAGAAGEVAYSSYPEKIGLYYFDGSTWKPVGATGWYVPSDIKTTTAAHDGNFGGYDGQLQWIQQNGCEGYHVCDAEEITRYLQMGKSITYSRIGDYYSSYGYVMAFYNTGLQWSRDVFGSRMYTGDCYAWTGGNVANTWFFYPGYKEGTSSFMGCGTPSPVMCCK